MSEHSTLEAGTEYDVQRIEATWSGYWDENRVTRPPTTALRNGATCSTRLLPLRPLHMGHAEAFAMGDVVARYWWHRGYDATHPVGWDSLGCPRRTPRSSATPTPRSGPTAHPHPARVLQRYAISADWDRRSTSDLSTTAGPSGCSWSPLPRAWPTRRTPRSTGAPGPDRAGQRAGGQRGLRALPHPRDQEVPGNEWGLQDHRLRPSACWTT
ncbi:hypothetical protein QJS66_03805 [Kocuria rhizophila]|nr:hypothetical protein QJS66_03805 [Kocuria rhizophila]